MFDTDLTTLDAVATVDHAVQIRQLIDAGEARMLAVAAHYADLHGVLDHADDAGRALPGTERLIGLGGAGTPEVAEFAPAELGAALGVSDTSAAMLIGDGLDLRHRLPRLWARITAGEVPAWIGRRTAQTTRGCTQACVAVVDRRVAPFADKLTWGRLESIVRGAIIAADPAQAALDAEVAAESVGVFRSRSTGHGIITTILRTQAPDAIVFDAAIGRVATGLGLLGDTRPQDTRRAAAVGVLANPQHTLDLYQQAAEVAATDPEATSAVGDGGYTDADAPTTPADPLLDPAQHQPLPAPTGVRRRSRRVDPRPPAVLYVHLTDQALHAGAGVARVEDVGPVTVDQVKTWLGHTRVTVKPVLDLAGQAPVDGYEVPDRLREAVHLVNPADCLPYATSTGRRQDIDHTIPFVPPSRGGPPGQTRIGNLNTFIRRRHRLKTFSRWQVRQPFPGIWIWRSPHGRYYLVDHTGTTPLGKATPASAKLAPEAVDERPRVAALSS